MKHLIEDIGGNTFTQPHIEKVLTALPVYWKNALPTHVKIKIVPNRTHLPHVPEIWGSHNTIPRDWSVRKVSTGPYKPILIFVYLELINGCDREYLFKRDIATALLTCTFDQQHIQRTLMETIKQWSHTRFGINTMLAEIFAAFIINRSLAESVHPKFICLVDAIEKDLASIVYV